MQMPHLVPQCQTLKLRGLILTNSRLKEKKQGEYCTALF